MENLLDIFKKYAHIDYDLRHEMYEYISDYIVGIYNGEPIIDSEDPNILYWNGQYYINTNQNDKAYEQWEKGMLCNGSNCINALVYYYEKYDLYEDRAYELRSRAIELNSYYGTVNMGCYYFEKEDYPMAIEYWEKACEKDIRQGYYNLGMYYGVIEENNDKMLYYWEKGCEKMSVNCYHALGSYHYTKMNNIDLAMEYWKKGIEMFSGTCALDIGTYHALNNDNDLAKEYYHIGISFGNFQGYYYLGTLEYKNNNLDLAKEYWEKGCEYHNGSCYNGMSAIYKDDPDKQLEYWLLGAREKNIDCINVVCCYYSINHNEEEYKKYMFMGAKLKSQLCLYKLAKYYTEKKNYRLALKTVKKCSTKIDVNNKVFYENMLCLCMYLCQSLLHVEDTMKYCKIYLENGTDNNIKKDLLKILMDNYENNDNNNYLKYKNMLDDLEK